MNSYALYIEATVVNSNTNLIKLVNFLVELAGFFYNIYDQTNGTYLDQNMEHTLKQCEKQTNGTFCNTSKWLKS